MKYCGIVVSRNIEKGLNSLQDTSLLSVLNQAIAKSALDFGLSIQRHAMTASIFMPAQAAVLKHQCDVSPGDLLSL